MATKNVRADGLPKTREQIREELFVQRDQWLSEVGIL